jgi:hypothetical protein
MQAINLISHYSYHLDIDFLEERACNFRRFLIARALICWIYLQPVNEFSIDQVTQHDREGGHVRYGRSISPGLGLPH